MDNQNEQPNQGEISRLLLEKAKQGFEFGKLGKAKEKEIVHVGKPESNNVGIDRNSWAD